PSLLFGPALKSGTRTSPRLLGRAGRRLLLAGGGLSLSISLTPGCGPVPRRGAEARGFAAHARLRTEHRRDRSPPPARPGRGAAGAERQRPVLPGLRGLPGGGGGPPGPRVEQRPVGRPPPAGLAPGRPPPRQGVRGLRGRIRLPA